jgi:hypothetical protein
MDKIKVRHGLVRFVFTVVDVNVPVVVDHLHKAEIEGQKRVHGQIVFKEDERSGNSEEEHTERRIFRETHFFVKF